MKAEKGPEHRPVVNKVVYTSSPLELWICSLSHVSTYLHNRPLVLTLKHSRVLCRLQAAPLTRMVPESGAPGLMH